MIGIVGGVGPYAGLDLATKICDQTLAHSDQEHLPVVLLSVPHTIADRTAFLLGQTPVNPAYALAAVICQLEAVGATVVGIPCNTAHSPRIFDVILAELAAAGSRVQVVHMIRETARFLAEHPQRPRRVGVLCTTGTARTRVYQEALAAFGMAALLPDDPTQEAVHAAIYDPTYGIKAQAHPVTARAQQQLRQAAQHLLEQGAEALVLGCTEIPLALSALPGEPVPVIDPTLILARALIRETYPARLKPLSEASHAHPASHTSS